MNFEHLETNLGTNMVDHSPHKLTAFEGQAPMVDEIRQYGFEKFLKNVTNLQQAFDLSLNQPPEANVALCCMDEGTPFGIHSAGSGLLLSEKDFANFIKQEKPDTITSHSGCGAAKLYCQKHGLKTSNPDEVAKAWALDMAKKYGLKYVHIETEQMNRPDFHDAQVCYVDATGKFNYAGADNLPKGFVVNWRQGETAALAESEVAANIIFSDHGLESHLSEQKPFVYVAIGNNPEETENIKQKLQPLKEQFGNKIIIDGFTAPQG